VKADSLMAVVYDNQIRLCCGQNRHEQDART